MKYLSVFVFMCIFSWSCNAGTVIQYDLSINDETNKFSGDLYLKVPTKEAKLTLNIGLGVNIKKCTYMKDSGSADCQISPKEKGNVEIQFPEIKGDLVNLNYDGKYGVDGLSKETIDGKIYYFASFADGRVVNVLPCVKTDTSKFSIKILANGKNVKLHINIKKSDEVYLQGIVFVGGDLNSIQNNVPETEIELIGVKNYGKKTYAGEELSNAILKKIREGLKCTVSAKVSQILFPHSIIRDINGEFITTHSIKNYVFENNIGTFREQSMLTDLIRRLSEIWFPASKLEGGWLSAGLSAFLAYYAIHQWPTDRIKAKNLNAMDQFVVDHQLRAFEADGFASSVALKESINLNSSYTDVLMNPIRFSKGASIMKYLRGICNDEKFTAALGKIAKAKSMGVDQFGESFKSCFDKEQAANQFLQKWQDSPGYPVVHVMVDRKTGTLNLTQERFVWNTIDTNKKKLWCLYITYVTSNKKTGNMWLLDEPAKLKVDGDFNWIIINVNRDGYYRVNYDMNTWNAIISQLQKNHTEINELNRAQIIDDMFSFARSAHNYSQYIPDYKMAFKLFDYLKKETEYIPLKAAFNAIEYLDFALAGDPAHSRFRALVKNFIEPLYQKYSLESTQTDHVRKLLRREIGSWACKLGVQECVTAAHEYYKNMTFIDDFVMDPDIEDIVYCTVVSNSTDKWFTLFAMFHSPDITPIKAETLIKGLGCSRDNKLLNRFINKLRNQPSVVNYRFDVISSLLNGNPGRVALSLEFFKPKSNTVTDSEQSYLEKAVELTLRKLNNADSAALLSFAKNYLGNTSFITYEVESVVSTIREWHNKKKAAITEALDSGESRTKPMTLIITLSAVLPFATYLFRY